MALASVGSGQTVADGWQTSVMELAGRQSPGPCCCCCCCCTFPAQPPPCNPAAGAQPAAAAPATSPAEIPSTTLSARVEKKPAVTHLLRALALSPYVCVSFSALLNVDLTTRFSNRTLGENSTNHYHKSDKYGMTSNVKQSEIY